MRYKADYAPSYLLDPVRESDLGADIAQQFLLQEEYTWFPLKECIPLLDKHRYICFSQRGSLDEDPGPEQSMRLSQYLPCWLTFCVSLKSPMTFHLMFSPTLIS